MRRRESISILFSCPSDSIGGKETQIDLKIKRIGFFNELDMRGEEKKEKGERSLMFKEAEQPNKKWKGMINN